MRLLEYDYRGKMIFMVGTLGGQLDLTALTLRDALGCCISDQHHHWLLEG